MLPKIPASPNDLMSGAALKQSSLTPNVASSPVASLGNSSHKPGASIVPPPPRSESMAYPPMNSRTRLSQMQYHLRQNTRAVGTAIAVLIFVVLVWMADAVSGNRRGNSAHAYYSNASGSNLRGSSTEPFQFGGARHSGYFSVSDSLVVEDGSIVGHRFGFLTDLDELSKLAGESKPTFVSYFVPGVLQVLPSGSPYQYDIRFDASAVRKLITKHNEAGRGAEFSELTVFNNRLLTADDRTGDIFEILNTADGADSYAVPRLVITEGPGDTDKGMKWEWSTVKDNKLYLGSMGKEYTNKAGEIVNVNNLWIVTIDEQGRVRRENWSEVYGVVRKALHAEAPGYIIMEAVNWSEELGQWVFLPRRISKQPYDDVADEKRGGRQLVLVSPDFKRTQIVDLKLESTDPLKGFSSFAFIPRTHDKHILAIRSIEEDCAVDGGQCKQRSYLVAIDIMTGQQVSEEKEYPQPWKFEGIEFFNPYRVPPVYDDD